MLMKDKIKQDMIAAMKAKEERRLGIIRLMMAAIKQKEVDERIEVNDSQVFEIMNKMIKQRRDSASQYTHAGRSDLADQENYEIDVIQTYLPEGLSEAEIDQLIKKAINEAQASSARDMGKVMALLKPEIQGRADVGAVSNKVKELLSQ